MSEENKNPRRRRFDPSMRGATFVEGEVPKFDPGNPVIGIMGQMLGGIGTGLGAGLANKMSERTMVAAAALQGILANPDVTGNMKDHVADAVKFADMLLAELEKTDDPRFDSEDVEK